MKKAVFTLLLAVVMSFGIFFGACAETAVDATAFEFTAEDFVTALLEQCKGEVAAREENTIHVEIKKAAPVVVCFAPETGLCTEIYTEVEDKNVNSAIKNGMAKMTKSMGQVILTIDLMKDSELNVKQAQKDIKAGFSELVADLTKDSFVDAIWGDEVKFESVISGHNAVFTLNYDLFSELYSLKIDYLP